MPNDNAKLWKLHTQNGPLIINDNYIAIGWAKIGDLRNLRKSINEFKDAYKSVYTEDEPSIAEANATILYSFFSDIKVGDYVTYHTNNDGMIHIGKVIEGYIFNERENKYPHMYLTEWIKHFPDRYIHDEDNKVIIKDKSYCDSCFELLQGNVREELISFLDPNKIYIEIDDHNDWQKARINQLLSYMADCQQGMRDLKGQMLTILSVVSSLLYLLFGISIFIDNERNKSILSLPANTKSIIGRLFEALDLIITRQRLYFWFTSIIFIAAVLYIVYLGIEAILRYHYSQHLADRLHTLIPGTADDIDRNALLTFEQFAGPIRTLNYLHLNNSHGLFSLFAYYIAVILAGLFCMGMVLTQFALIDEARWYDKIILGLTIFTITIAILNFVRFYNCADDISDMAFITGNENLEVRKGISNEEMYRHATEFREFFHYLLYPRKESIIKAFLIIEGFTLATINCTGFDLNMFYVTHLGYILIVYELLLYQARYQFNDIRGLDDGKNVGEDQDRLVSYVDKNKPFRIKISMIMVVFRLVAAIAMIAFLGKNIKPELFVMLVVLLIVTILYEISRSKKSVRLIIPLVGLGFPLRFSAGVFAVKDNILKGCNWLDIIIMFFLLWLWGTAVEQMSWVRKIDELVANGDIKNENDLKKAHYKSLYPMVSKRRSGLNKHESVLGVKGEFHDLWNICYAGILLLLVIYRLNNINYRFLLIIPFICIVWASDFVINSNEYRLIKVIGCLTGATLDLYGSWLFGCDCVKVFIYNCLLISVIISMYYLKRGIREKTTHEDLRETILRFVFGNEAYNGSVEKKTA